MRACSTAMSMEKNVIYLNNDLFLIIRNSQGPSGLQCKFDADLW